MKKGILFITLFSVFLSCKRDTDPNKFGPETIIVSEDFTVTGFTVSPSNFINLATQDAYFNCTMSQRAEFKFVISGLLSGAVKTVSGAGQSIDILNSTWTGDSDNLNLFRSGEKCLVELSFHGAKKKYYDTITVTAENSYPNTILINNFEGVFFDKHGPNVAAYGNYFDGGDSAKSDIKSDNTTKTCEGAQSVLFDGVDVNKSFYIGGMYFFPATTTYSFAGYEPDSLYFNTYLYSYGDNSTNFVFSYTETDGDIWTKQVSVDGLGWTLLSLRLKDFTDSNLGLGNGILNLDKITGFNINLNAKTAGTRARANLDYIIVSYGRPFEP